MLKEVQTARLSEGRKGGYSKGLDLILPRHVDNLSIIDTKFTSRSLLVSEILGLRVNSFYSLSDRWH